MKIFVFDIWEIFRPILHIFESSILYIYANRGYYFRGIQFFRCIAGQDRRLQPQLIQLVEDLRPSEDCHLCRHFIFSDDTHFCFKRERIAFFSRHSHKVCECRCLEHYRYMWVERPYYPVKHVFISSNWNTLQD